MSAFIGAALVIAGFLLLMVRFRLVARARRVFAISHRALRELRDPALDDEAKELAMRVHAIRLGGLFITLAGGGIAAFAAPLAVVALLDAAAMMSFHSVVQLLLSWWMIAAASALTIATIALSRRRIDGV